MKRVSISAAIPLVAVVLSLPGALAANHLDDIRSYWLDEHSRLAEEISSIRCGSTETPPYGLAKISAADFRCLPGPYDASPTDVVLRRTRLLYENLSRLPGASSTIANLGGRLADLERAWQQRRAGLSKVASGAEMSMFRRSAFCAGSWPYRPPRKLR